MIFFFGNTANEQNEHIFCKNWSKILMEYVAKNWWSPLDTRFVIDLFIFMAQLTLQWTKEAFHEKF